MVVTTIANNKTVDRFGPLVYIAVTSIERSKVVITHVKFVSIPTRDQYKALAFYTEKLGFKLVTDQPHDEKQRWIEMRIGSSDTRLVLFTMDESRVGGMSNATLACDNVERTYNELKERGVKFISPPKQTEWGA